MPESVEVIKLQGTLENTSGREMLATVQQQVTTCTQVLLLDFEQVNFVDSGGLACLVKLMKLTQRAGIRLALCSLQVSVVLILRSTSLYSVFETFASQPAFFAALQQDFSPRVSF